MTRRYLDADKLTGTQAIELLGLSRWKFYELVKAGTIKRYMEKPYKVGYYLRREIEDYQRELAEANQPPQG